MYSFEGKFCFRHRSFSAEWESSWDYTIVQMIIKVLRGQVAAILDTRAMRAIIVFFIIGTPVLIAFTFRI